MDNSPVAAPSGSVQDQNNSKSTSKLESSQMETSEENPAHGSSASKTQSDTVNSEEPAKSPENTTEEKPPAFMPTEETKAETEQESQQTITASNLYPVLSDESEVTPKTDLDSITEQVANASSETEAHNSHASSLPEGKKSSESVPDEQSAHSTSAESLKKDESREKAESSESQRLPAAAPVTEAESAQSTLKSAADGVEAPESLPSTSQYGAEAEAPASEGVTAAASAAAEEGAVGGKNSSPTNGESVYYVKWINFNNGRVPVITQNENGPCPLLAIVNVLLLKGKVRLASIVEMITSEQLMAHLGECVVESKPKNLDETHRANYEQNMQDAMDMMHKLQTGLDVNVKFTGVSDFEYTSECIIFDLLQLALYHGWLVDPQNEEEVKAVGKCSYNQLVEKIIQYKQSDKEEMVREALIAEQFLDRTAAQLTYHGLCELSSTVKEQELCVFFRNNHFNTLLRHNNELFLLVTDQGFLTESNVVWETLSNVDGDCHFVDANFCTYTKPPPSTDPITSSPYSSGDEQINSDYQVALSLQHHDQQIIAEQEAAWGQYHQQESGTAHNADHEMALRLQEEEDRRAAAAFQEQRTQAQGQATGSQGQGAAVATGSDRRPREDRREKKEGKDCCIL